MPNSVTVMHVKPISQGAGLPAPPLLALALLRRQKLLGLKIWRGDNFTVYRGTVNKTSVSYSQ